MALRERFEPASKREHYKLGFERRKKSKTENWADFGDDLCSLADRTFPDFQDEAKEKLTLFRYLSQVEFQQLSFAVKQRQPQTIREAVDAIIEFESYTSSDQSRDQSNEPLAKNHQPLHQLQCLNDTLQNLQRRLADLECSAPSQLTALPLTRTRWSRRLLSLNRAISGGHPVTCRKCKHPGHYAIGCTPIRTSMML